MKVPFLDLGLQHAAIREALDKALSAVIDDAAFASGPFVDAFEKDFASYVGTRHCVGVNSGTTALHLALLAAGIKGGDEVVTTPHTWISTSWAISYCGAVPVFADVDPATGNLSPETANAAISTKTAAILPVDLYGNPADHATFEKVASDHGVVLIADAAQSHGAWLGERRVGQFGLATCFSFYPGKNLGALGEGGAIVTDDDDVADRIRTLRDHAQRGRHNHVEIGFNARMDGIQAAALSVKLQHLDEWNEGRRTAARRYSEMLQGIESITLPETTPNGLSSWHLYPIRVAHRDALGSALNARGIATGIHYPTPIHLQPAYAFLGHTRGSFPAAETYAATCLSLPMFPEITAAQQEFVVASIIESLKSLR